MARLLVICGAQRNGSTALLEALGATEKLYDCAEFLHSEGVRPSERARSLRLNTEANFFAFAETRRGDLFGSLINTRETRRAQWRAYLAHLDVLAGGRPWLGLNIKFMSWHNLDHVWQDLNYPPMLVRLMIEAEAKFVLVNRRGVVAQALSERRAAETDQWHAARGEGSGDVPPVEIDPARLIRRARQWTIQSRRLTHWLSPHDFTAFDYEDLFEGSRLSPLARSHFASVLGVDEAALAGEPPLEKLPRPTCGWIANAAEVAARLSETELAGEAPSVLAQAAPISP